jgi:hypothetical protein
VDRSREAERRADLSIEYIADSWRRVEMLLCCVAIAMPSDDARHVA